MSLGAAPATLEEAILTIIKIINEGAPSMWDELEGTFVSHLHHSLGQDIRNSWGFWTQDSELYKYLAGHYMLSHADDLSGIVLRATYRTYHDEDLELEEYAAQLHDFWAKSLRGEPISITVFQETKNDSK